MKVPIIVPLRVARHTWSSEIEKWDHLRVRLRSGGEPSCRMPNRENIPWIVEESGLPFDFDMVVVDELSSFKNPQAKRFKALMKERKKARRIVGLMGTPSSNGLMEYKFLDMGRCLGQFIGGYRTEYFRPDKMNGPGIYSIS